MLCGKFGRRTLTSFIAGAALAIAMPALAQTGRIQGKVVDQKDQPVPDAQGVVADQNTQQDQVALLVQTRFLVLRQRLSGHSQGG